MTKTRHAWRILVLMVYTGENHLSFIETSALDASNVELAFQNILTGEDHPIHISHPGPMLIKIPYYRDLPNCIKQGSRQR